MNLNRKKRLANMLNGHFTPDHLEVINESHAHRVPKDAETHFKLIIVSEAFADLTRIQRHRLVQNLIQTEFTSGLHACSMHLCTPTEWQKQPQAIASPACAHQTS
jgi:BolA protein